VPYTTVLTDTSTNEEDAFFKRYQSFRWNKNSIHINLSYNSSPQHPEGTKQRSYFLCSDLTMTIFLSALWLW
jgi:hypothetical protein